MKRWAVPVLRYDKSLKFDEMWPKREDGKCRCGCDQALTGKRTQWATDECSKKALDQFWFRKGNSQTIRKLVKARDNGVCAICGLDTEKARKQCSFWGHHYKQSEAWNARKRQEAAKAREHFMQLGFPSPSGSWWQADHTLPLAEGGTHTLENIRTLCIVCHKGETKALAGRRARARRGMDQVPLLAL